MVILCQIVLKILSILFALPPKIHSDIEAEVVVKMAGVGTSGLLATSLFYSQYRYQAIRKYQRSRVVGGRMGTHASRGLSVIISLRCV